MVCLHMLPFFGAGQRVAFIVFKGAEIMDREVDLHLLNQGLCLFNNRFF